MKRSHVGLFALLLLALCAVVWHGAPSSLALRARSSDTATPQGPAPIVIASEVFAHVAPAAVASPELGLARVTIMPGAAIPPHYHPGTQMGFVAQGDLTYEVFSGDVLLYRGDDPGAAPEVITAGETALARPGDILVEPPGSIHQGRNEGAAPTTIYVSTLFPAGAPRSIVVEATPVP
jgi:quercetin dioxygenase-like cupin family protein